MPDEKAIDVTTGGAPGLQKGHASSGWSYRPRIDVLEDADEFTIRADLPGTTAEKIDIGYENRTLTIRGSVPARQGGGVEFVVHEYGVGDFDRELVLPEGIEVERIHAELDHGVLTIHAPKSEALKPRRIPIKTG